MTLPADRKSILEVEFKSAPGSFRATIATLGVVDKDGDVILPGAFKDGAAIVVSAYQHTSWSGALPVGSAVLASNGQKGWADGQFLQTNAGRETYETVKALAAKGLGEWSFGFSVKAGTVVPEELGRYPGAKRIISELEVYEASPVMVGAGVGTGTDYIKAAGLAPTDQELIEHTADALLFAESAAAMAEAAEAGKSLGAAFEYSEVHPDMVPAETKQLAARALLVSCADLGIPAPRVTWMQPGRPNPAAKRITSDTAILAMAYPSKSEIWLDSRLSGWDLVEAVAHEVKHVALGHQVGAEDLAAAYGRGARDWRIS